jgi:hypothetical protein
MDARQWSSVLLTPRSCIAWKALARRAFRSLSLSRKAALNRAPSRPPLLVQGTSQIRGPLAIAGAGKQASRLPREGGLSPA